MSKNDIKAEDKSTKTKKDKRDGVQSIFVRAIIGVLLLALFGSIVFSTVAIWTGTDNPLFKWLVAPQAVFAIGIAFVAFSKILK